MENDPTNMHTGFSPMDTEFSKLDLAPSQKDGELSREDVYFYLKDLGLATLLLPKQFTIAVSAYSQSLRNPRSSPFLPAQ